MRAGVDQRAHPGLVPRRARTARHAQTTYVVQVTVRGLAAPTVTGKAQLFPDGACAVRDLTARPVTTDSGVVINRGQIGGQFKQAP